MFFTKHKHIQIIDNNGDAKYLTDITAVFNVPEFLKNSKLTEPYMVSDSDTPESLAYNFYGDSKMSWIILLTNGIKNIYSEWPLNADMFNSMIEKKYFPYFSVFLILGTTQTYDIKEGDVVKLISPLGNNPSAVVKNWNPSLSKLTLERDSLIGQFSGELSLYSVRTGESIGLIGRIVENEQDSLHHFEQDGVVLDPLIGHLQDYISGFNYSVVTNMEYETKLNNDKRSIVIPSPELARQIYNNYIPS